MANKKLDFLIKEAVQENADKITVLNEESIVPIDEMLQRVIPQTEMNHKVIQFENYKNRNFQGIVLRRGALIACCIICLSFIFTISFETVPAQAFKFNITKVFVDVRDNLFRIKHTTGEEHLADNQPSPMSNNNKIVQTLTLEQAQKKISFHIPIPQYMPKGYNLKQVEWTRYQNGRNVVKQAYINDNEEEINFFQTAVMGDIDRSDIATKDNDVSLVEVMGVEVSLISHNTKSHWGTWYKDGFEYEVYANTSKDELIKLLKSIK